MSCCHTILGAACPAAACADSAATAAGGAKRVGDAPGCAVGADPDPDPAAGEAADQAAAPADGGAESDAVERSSHAAGALTSAPGRRALRATSAAGSAAAAARAEGAPGGQTTSSVFCGHGGLGGAVGSEDSAAAAYSGTVGDVNTTVRAESAAAAAGVAGRAKGAAVGARSDAAASTGSPGTPGKAARAESVVAVFGGAISASCAAVAAADDAALAGQVAALLLSDEKVKVTYAMVFFGGAAEAAMAAKLDLLSSFELETLWENLAPGWKDFYEPAPTGANRDLDALARLDRHGYAGWPCLQEAGYRSMRNTIAVALASEKAFEANAARHRTRRGGSGRTRAQRPGGGSWVPGIYQGLADRNSASPRPPGAPYAFQSNWIILDRPLMSGAPYGASIFSRYIAASTETDEEDADVEDGCEGHAGGRVGR